LLGERRRGKRKRQEKAKGFLYLLEAWQNQKAAVLGKKEQERRKGGNGIEKKDAGIEEEPWKLTWPRGALGERKKKNEFPKIIRGQKDSGS